MSWKDQYKSKLCSAGAAVSHIKSGNKIFISANAATPGHLIEALASDKDRLFGVEINHVLLVGDDPLSKPGTEGHFRHNSLFVGSGDRKAVNEGRADYVPCFLSEIPSLFTTGLIPLDAALIHVSPPDEHGYMSYGLECLAAKAAAESSKTVIVLVNEHMPRTLGDCFIHVSKVDHIVEHSAQMPELPKESPSDIEIKIGNHIGELVEDESTLQLGIGGIPDAVLQSLGDKRDLGIHTEMVSDGVIKLIEAGIITNAKKNLHRGKVIATFIFGSHKLYSYVHNNPNFEMHPSNYTNDPFVIAKNDNMVAINSAIEVDLTGQICADSIGTKIYSGFGGQVDFIRGATRSKGGKPIIALPSMTKGKPISRIVPVLKPGAGVVTTRADVHYVITEFGVAYLHGKNLSQRAKALMDIAHPQFREELERKAYEANYLSRTSFPAGAEAAAGK